MPRKAKAGKRKNSEPPEGGVDGGSSAPSLSGQERELKVDEVSCSEIKGAKEFWWVGLDATSLTDPEIIASWPEGREQKARWWKRAKVQERVDFLTSKEFSDKVSEDCEYGVIVMVREFQRVVNVLTQNITALKINTRILEDSIKPMAMPLLSRGEAERERKRADDAEQEAVKLRAEMENMVTYEAANAKIHEVVNDKDAEIKRRTNLAVERIKKAEKALKDSQAEAERWKEKAEDSEKGEVEDLRVQLVEAVKKVKEKEEENQRAEAEMCALRAELAEVEKKKEEKKRDPVTSVDVGVNTDEVVEVAVRPEPMEGVIGLADSEVPAVPTVHQRRSSSAKHRRGSVSNGGGSPRSHGNGGEGAGAMAKAVVVHGININWKVSGVADCVEGIMGKAIGARWLLGAGRRVGKTASSVVVYLNEEVFLGPRAYIRMAGVEHSVVPYCWRV